MCDLQSIQTIEIIHLGDELLFGLRVNTHLEYLGRLFSQYGTTVVRDQVIRDNHEEILKCLQSSFGKTDLLILTGGLGPTVDDITREAVAEFFGLELIFNESILEVIENRFANQNRSMPNSIRKQCYQIAGSEVLSNTNGTAPGLWLEQAGKLLILLPGPPRELKPMVENVVIPKLLSKKWIHEQAPYIQIRSHGIGESQLEEKLQPIAQKYPNINLAYCAHSGVVDVRFSSIRFNHPNCKLAAEEAKEILEANFVGFGECNIAQTIVEFLLETEQTIAVAESITGGLISSAIVDIPGASQAFAGGFVSYTNEAKIQTVKVPEAIIQQHGAVSPETAIAMATCAAEEFSANYGVSITGYAGPTGGTEDDPIGTVYIGYHSPSGTWAQRRSLNGDRQTIRQRATLAALDLVRRKQQKYREEDKANNS